MDARVIFAKCDSPIHFIKGTLRLVTAALMVVLKMKKFVCKKSQGKIRYGW